jgi:hypothetical protein
LLLRKIEAERAAAGKRHMESIKGHIKGLSGKNYQSLCSLNSLDFVLLFVPIEPVFMLAVASDKDLFMDAWNRNVLPWSEAKSSIPRVDKAVLLPGVSVQRLQEDWHALNAGILGLAAAGCCG